MKVALFGGTFNPPHLGHVHVAHLLSKRFDEVWVVVAADPNKTEKPYVPPEHRLKMAELAFGGVKNVRIVDIELKRSGVSYTFDTVRQLRADFPKHEFWWVVGSDLVADFPRWKQSATLAKSVPFLVVSRPGFAIDPAGLERFAQVDVLEDEGVDASSTQLRAWLHSGKQSGAKARIPAAVFEYLKTHRLYA
ncbi:nicotinate (nicotinamide) nucleotide adenylyltransferase [Candidatus Micrarchaeota archaeon]|nr:nicotinate (nicotinamide) nucleotide adenylyltransferase [Candidatus Micrarchaeota archaeon]